jgi:hypothetical protein
MRRMLLSAANTLVALLVVVGLVLALDACGAGGAKEQAKAPRPLPENGNALRAGKYRSEEFKPSLSFRVGEGWSNAPLEAPSFLGITRVDNETLGFYDVQEVYKPTRTGMPTKVVDAPKDLVGWFQHHPYLQTSKPQPVMIGGVKAVRLDMVLGDLPRDYYGLCRSIVGNRNCVDIASVPTDSPRGDLELFVTKADKIRSIVLEGVGGETVTIGFGSPAAEFDEFAPKTQKVLRTVEWKDA